MNEIEISEFVAGCDPLPSPGRLPEALAECVKPERQKEKQQMPDKTKGIREKVILAVFAVMVAAPRSFGGADLPPGGGKVETRPVSTLWHVIYRGGPNIPRQATDVDLRISESTISYAAADGRAGSEFSIPVADVTDVSDAIIAGNLDEKVFGPDDLDPTGFVSHCVKLPDHGPEEACIAGGIGLYMPFWIVRGVLENIPYKDRFIRVDWQRKGEKSAAVFQVRRKDYTPVREELESVTEKWLGNRVPEEPPYEALRPDPITLIPVPDPDVVRIHVQRWLSDQCQSSSLDKPSWLRPSFSGKILTLCPSTTREVDKARDQLLAK